MKKIYLLFVAAALAACSAEPVENEVLTGLDANLEGKTNKVTTQDVAESFNPPNEVCMGEIATFCLTFPQKFKGNGDPQTTNVQVQLEVAPGDWVQIDKGEGNMEFCFSYVFEEDKLYKLRYFIGSGGHTEVSVNVDDCSPICTYGKGYWRNHSNDNPGNQSDEWPVTELMLGNHSYSQSELNTILDVPNNEGNSLVIFSQHLIAAKLNIANGAGNLEIEATIAEADEIIGDLVILQGSFSEEQKKVANSLKDLIESFNESSPCENTDNNNGE